MEKQRQSGVQPKALEEVGSSVEETNGIIVEDGEESQQTTSSDTCQEDGEVPEWMQSLENNLLSTSRSKPTLTRKEKREKTASIPPQGVRKPPKTHCRCRLSNLLLSRKKMLHWSKRPVDTHRQLESVSLKEMVLSTGDG